MSINKTRKFLLFTLILIFSSVALGLGSQSQAQVELQQHGWSQQTKARLEKLITEGAEKGLKVVFDFDNTLICRDIGEATFAVLLRDGILDMSNIPASLLRDFRLDDRVISPHGTVDLSEYYNLYTKLTDHQPSDPNSEISSFSWLIEIMSGLSPLDVINATKKAYNEGQARKDMAGGPQSVIEVTKGQTSYRAPFFYPQMVELVGVMIDHGYDVWVVSASNVWTVRWMATKALTQELANMGFSGAIRAEHVIGISTLIKDASQTYYKDTALVRDNQDYAALNPEELQKYTIDTQVVFPLSGFYGKVANIMQWVGQRPYLIAGDSPNDLPMLDYAINKLWIARLEKPHYQKKMLAKRSGDNQDKWIVQPTLYKTMPGFVPSMHNLKSRLGDLSGSVKVKESLGLLKSLK